MGKIWPYIEDKTLLLEVQAVLRQLSQEMDSIDVYRNVVDPFSAIFDIAKQELSFDEWIEQEQARQSQKTLQNLVGYFHQRILGHVEGWNDPGRGGSLDLINDDRKIIAEIKNKYNTFNSSSAMQTYRKMTGHLDGDKKGYQGYVVTIIPKRPVRVKKKFAPNDDGGVRVPVRDDLLLVDGASIYEIVTGDKDALKKLYMCLPVVIDQVMPESAFNANKARKLNLNELFTRAFGE